MKPSAIPLVRSLPLPRFSRPVAIVWVFVAIVLCLVGLVVFSEDALFVGFVGFTVFTGLPGTGR